jgi:hypothetical protein
LEDYLCWWDMMVPDILGPGQFGLLGISYEAELSEDPEEFHKIVTEQLKLEDRPYKNIECHVLLRFSDVDKKHLRMFMDKVGFPLPTNRQEEIVQQVWERSQGLYEAIIQELLAWLRRGFSRGV